MDQSGICNPYKRVQIRVERICGSKFGRNSTPYALECTTYMNESVLRIRFRVARHHDVARVDPSFPVRWGYIMYGVHMEGVCIYVLCKCHMHQSYWTCVKHGVKQLVAVTSCSQRGAFEGCPCTRNVIGMYGVQSCIKTGLAPDIHVVEAR